MIKSELLRDQGILIIAPDGPIEKADFKRLANEIDPVIASKGKLAGVMIYANRSRAGTAWEHLYHTLSLWPIIIDRLSASPP